MVTWVLFLSDRIFLEADKIMDDTIAAMCLNAFIMKFDNEGTKRKPNLFQEHPKRSAEAETLNQIR